MLGLPLDRPARRELQDELHVEVGDEEVRVGRSHHEDAHVGVLLHLFGERGELSEQLEGHEVDRRIVDGGGGDPTGHLHVHERQVIGHGAGQ